jgi:hypothetical protein
MPQTPYEYELSDFPNNAVDTGRLQAEVDDDASITKKLIGISESTQVVLTFADVLSAGEETALDAVVASHSGVPQSFDEVVKTSVQKPREPEFNFHTPNWCDPTTWYQRSVRVTGEVMQCTNPGTWTNYSTKHKQVIDMRHGKIMMEDRISAPYIVKVYVNGVLKKEDKPLDYLRRQYDYCVDYLAGAIEFHEPLTESDVVTIDYSHSKNSSFTMAPIPGKKIVVNMAEADFSVGYEVRDTIRYQAFAPAAVLMAQAPTSFPSVAHVQGWLQSQEVFSPDGSIEALNKFLGKVDSLGEGLSEALTEADKVPVPDTDRVYKVYWDFKSQSNGNHSPMPPLGGALRGETEGSAAHSFGYVTAKEIDSRTGAEIRIWLEEHIPFGGSRATATFYCSVEDV